MKPKILCVTGGMGSGKSTAVRILAQKGWPVYPADERAKELVSRRPELQAKLKKAFGDDAVNENGSVNPDVLSQCAFRDKESWMLLNSIIHPAVHDDFLDWLDRCTPGPHSWVIRESALAFEVGSVEVCTRVLLITAPLSLRKKRIALRQPLRDPEMLYRRMEFMWDDERLIHHLRPSDGHLINGGSTEEFEDAVLRWAKNLDSCPG